MDSPDLPCGRAPRMPIVFKDGEEQVVPPSAASTEALRMPQLPMSSPVDGSVMASWNFVRGC
jgi:hypothetical protein